MSWHDIKQGIKNLIGWFPIVWKDRDWDYNFLLLLMRFKLKRMEKEFRSYNDTIVSNKLSADKIRECVLLLDRIIEDKYTAFDKHDKKWGEPDFKFVNTDNPELTELKIVRPNVKTDEDERQERKEWSRCLKHEDALKEQDWKRFYDNLIKYMKGWWD